MSNKSKTQAMNTSVDSSNCFNLNGSKVNCHILSHDKNIIYVSIVQGLQHVFHFSL